MLLQTTQKSSFPGSHSVTIWSYNGAMTTILGIQFEDSCLLVADSRETDEGGRPSSHPDICKITQRGFTKRDEYLIAGAGSANPCDIVQHIWEPPQIPDENIYKFMVTKVAPSIRQVIKDNGYEPKKDEEPDFVFLIAVRGELFEIDSTCTVSRRVDGIYGIGSGSKYAIGALQAGADWEMAMAIAERNDIYTAKPFRVFTQSKTWFSGLSLR